MRLHLVVWLLQVESGCFVEQRGEAGPAGRLGERGILIEAFLLLDTSMGGTFRSRLRCIADPDAATREEPSDERAELLADPLR